MQTTAVHAHGASHEIALLERFVGDCVHHLPSLPSALPHQLPPRGASYHTGCSTMLREVLRVLAPQSPRLGQLVAQIWDLTSLNVFALLQLAHTTLDEKDAAHAKWRQLQRFCDETTAQHARRAAAYEDELERTRVEARELRAELQKTRQRANRLGVENAQLRRAVQGLLEMNDALHTRANAVEKLDDTPIGATGGGNDAEEWELYGVGADELEKLAVVHPIESYAQDFDQLFEGLLDRAREQLGLVNELDRFMNSNVVALLWRHGPDESATKFLELMMSRRTTGSQTNDDELGLLADDLRVGATDELGDDGDDNDDDNNHAHWSSGETGTATAVTKRQLLPPSLRAQLTTRPKIPRVLEKHELSRVVLLLLVDKMESDGAALRATRPRVPLHRFLKDFFLARYGLVALAEYRMMELIKSVLYYHEKLETEARRVRQLTGTAAPHAEEPPLSLTAQSTDDDAAAFTLLPGLACLPLHGDDLRVALFARLSELVPLQWAPSQIAPPAGNLLACATNALVDFLGDVIELDRTSPTVRDVLERHDWELSLDVASQLVAHHFAYCDRPRLELLQRRLDRLAGGEVASSLAPVGVDALLLFFATQWFEIDQRLTAKLHDTFHREAARQHALLASYGRPESNGPPPSSPMETLKRIWRMLPDEHVSLPEMDELERAFATILELRQSQQQRRVSKRQSLAAAAAAATVSSSSSSPGSSGGATTRPTSAVAAAAVPASSMGLCVGGISEKEFVFQSQQILRARRVCRGLRTNGRGVSVAATAQVLGPRGRPLPSDDATFGVDELKPPS